jgi:hypothetical protein
MKTAEIKKQFGVERNDANEVVKLFVFPTNSAMPMIEVRSYNDDGVDNAISAVYAGADFLRHKLYEHPLTQEGLHFNATRGVENQLIQNNVAAVSVNYANHNEFWLPRVSQEKYEFGWASVSLNNRIYTLSRPDDEKVFGRKHNFVDYLISGYGLDIRIPAFLARPRSKDGRIWIEEQIVTWETTNDAEALLRRNNAIKSKIDRDYMYAPIAKAKQNGGITAADFDNVKKDALVTLLDNSKVELGSLAYRRYRVYNGSHIVRTMTWDGKDEACVYMAQVLKKQWRLEQI